MTLCKLKETLAPEDRTAIDMLYSLYFDLYKNLEDSSTLDDIGFYIGKLSERYGSEVLGRFLSSDEIRALKNE